MNAMTGCRRFGVVLGLALCGISAKADDPQSVSWNWSANPTQGTSVLNALDWFVPANWTGNEPANSGLVKADFTAGCPVATRYVTADKAVTVADIESSRSGTFTTNSSQKLVFVSDHPFLLNRDASIDSVPAASGVMFYSDVSWFKTFYPSSLIFCGDVATEEGSQASLAFARGHPIEFRHDLYAKSSDPVRSPACGITGTTLNAGDLTMVAPHGASEPVLGVWSQTEGSPYIVRMGDAHVLCAGTVVTGEGIPEGAFVKRIFPDGIVELSAEATETIASNELTFAAFSPRLASAFSVYCAQNGTHNLWFMKWREEDEFRVTLTTFQVTKTDAVFVFDVKEGAVPATTVIRTAGSLMTGKVVFGTCRVEFGEIGKTGSPSLNDVADAAVSSASAVAHLVVSNGFDVGIANFSKIAGTLVKEGEGALSLELTGSAADYSGAVVVRGGDLTFTGEDELYVKTLAISNGATFHVPEGGVRCDRFFCEPGAVVSGPGSVTVTTFSEALLDVVCTDGAQVLYSDTIRHGEIFIEPPATNVPGAPAVWFDASRLDTLAYTEVDGTNRVSQWDDVRGADHAYAHVTCETKKPELWVGADGKGKYVYFQQDNNTGAVAESYELGWNRQISGIRSIFKVVGCSKGGGQFLGRSPLWRAAENRSYKDPVIYSTLTTVAPPETTRFYVNGEEKSWLNGYAYPGWAGKMLPQMQVPQVVEMHLDADHSTYAQGFSAQENSAKGRNGNQYLYEIIVYTNALTEAERLSVTGYLMQKWLNAEVNYETCSNVETLPSLAAGKTLGIAAGTKMCVESLTGEGTVTKSGDGELYLAECLSERTVLKVSCGLVDIHSAQVETDVPDGAVLHLDASDAQSFLTTRESGGTTYLTEWADTRGADYGTVRVRGADSGSNPIVQKKSLNGLDMVDVRSFSTGSDNCLTCGVLTVRSIFSVMNTAAGGGFLFGDSEVECNATYDDGFRGLVRYPTGRLTDALIWTLYSCTVSYFGPGATKMRLNGEDVNGTSAYYTGGDDLVSFRCYEGLTGNSVSHGIVTGPRYGGGKMIGELIYYPTRLSNGHARKIEAYFNKKWFGRDTPGYRQARLAAIDVADGATVSVVGGAPLVISSCAGEGTVQGALQFAADADWTVTVGADGVSSALTVTGTFDVSSVGRLVLSGTGKAAVGSYVLATTGGIVGDVSSIVIDSSAANGKRSYSLRQDGNDIVLDVQPFGLMMLVR